MPNQLYPFARALVADHSHVVRRYGTQFIDVFTWGELNEEVKSQSKREIATRDTRMLPKAVFEKYKSATLHTIKRKLPLKIIMLPLVVVVTLIVGFFAWRALQPDNLVGGIAENDAISGEAGNAPSTETNGKSSRPAITTADDYAAAHTPLVPGQPWTAPAYLDRPITVDPIMVCASSKAGLDGNDDWQDASCRCMSEQGTIYKIDKETCLIQARYGPAYKPVPGTAQAGAGPPRAAGGCRATPCGGWPCNGRSCCT